ncbi:MAG: glutamine synthetase family protein [Dongiaceae bacterium]
MALIRLRAETSQIKTPGEIAQVQAISSWIKEKAITEVECLVPDISGIARGKILPPQKLLSSLEENGLRLPESVFVQTVTGQYPEDETVTKETNSDVYLRPDPVTLRLVPWYSEPTAQVICDCVYVDEKPVDLAPREVLRKVVQLYDDRGWKPIVAPEVEFFLVSTNVDPDYPLKPPKGRSGRHETAPQSYGIDAVNEFDPLFEEVYDFCEAQDIDIDTLTHEAGAAQMEINFNHGDPLSLADQTFIFKRTVRQAAMRHKLYATFMAKPMMNEPGSAMHIHQSVVDKKTGKNLFALENGDNSPLFLSHIAGLQKYMPEACVLVAPNVNSFRRLRPDFDSPINLQWGRDNRTAGLRVPVSGPESRRLENRIPGADVNPYLAIAASLVCSYLGMVENLSPSEPVEETAYKFERTLPLDLVDAINRFQASRKLPELLGSRFCTVYAQVKQAEYEAYHRVISSWEREFLLLNV